MWHVTARDYSGPEQMYITSPGRKQKFTLLIQPLIKIPADNWVTTHLVKETVQFKSAHGWHSSCSRFLLAESTLVCSCSQ